MSEFRVCEGERVPETLPRMPRGQMQADLREQLAYPPTDLDQHKPKRVQLIRLTPASTSFARRASKSQ